MTKIVYKSNAKEQPNSIVVGDIKRGAIFKGRIPADSSRFFIKGYNCIVSLDRENQGAQWSNSVTVFNYEPLDGYLDLEES